MDAVQLLTVVASIGWTLFLHCDFRAKTIMPASEEHCRPTFQQTFNSRLRPWLRS